MPIVPVHSFTISIDGYSSAPGQALEHPFGQEAGVIAVG